MDIIAYWQGITVSAVLIVAIGAQNAWVLGQSIRGQHVVQTTLFCIVSDWLLIAMGVFGVGQTLARSPVLSQAAAWLGAAFLLIYGVQSWRRALLQQEELHIDSNGQLSQSRWAALGTTFIVTWLNPHAWLDTLVLLGGLASQLQAHSRGGFALGAMTLSCLWFCALSLLGRWLAPWFARAWTWKVLDGLIGALMLSLCWSLLRPLLLP